MDANEYQRRAMATSADHDTPDHRLINAALGLVGESGEVARLVGMAMAGDEVVERLLLLACHIGALADHLKKARYHGHQTNHLYIAQMLTSVRQSLPGLEAELLHEHTAGPPQREDIRLYTHAPLRMPDDRLIDEAGDVLWYVAQLADSRGLPLADVMQANIDKLAARYSEGFSPQASQERTE